MATLCFSRSSDRLAKYLRRNAWQTAEAFTVFKIGKGNDPKNYNEGQYLFIAHFSGTIIFGNGVKKHTLGSRSSDRLAKYLRRNAWQTAEAFTVRIQNREG